MTALLLAAAIAFTPADAHLAYETARTLVEKHTPRDSGTAGSKSAAAFLSSAAAAAGAKVTVAPFVAPSGEAKRTFTNVYGEIFPSCGRGVPAASLNENRTTNSNDWVVVVSHFDTKVGIACPGANDGAATAGLLVGLAQAWKRSGTTANLLLVWTDGEECVREYGPNDGLQGSKRAAEMLAKSGRKVRAVIVADMIGDRDLQISIPLNSSARLRSAAIAAAKQIGEPKLVRPLLGFIVDDHTPFLDRGFEAIDLIDFSYGPDNGLWHTPQDTMDKISEESLLKSGKLIVAVVDLIRRGEDAASTKLRAPCPVDAASRRVVQKENHP